MANRAIRMLSKYKNPKAIAECLSMLMDENALAPTEVHEVFQAMRNSKCSELAATLLCERFLVDYASVHERFRGQVINRELWEVFLKELVHYIRQVAGGRVNWNCTEISGSTVVPEQR